MVSLQVTDNQEEKRFEAEVGNHLAFIEYIRTTSLIYLTHTEVPPALEGRGVGSSLVNEVLGMIRESGLKLAPLCPFVAAYIRNNPQWKDLVDSRYSIG